MLAGDPHSQLTSASLLERLELECWEVPNITTTVDMVG